jgi:hypothetical protein
VEAASKKGNRPRAHLHQHSSTTGERPCLRRWILDSTKEEELDWAEREEGEAGSRRTVPSAQKAVLGRWKGMTTLGSLGSDLVTRGMEEAIVDQGSSQGEDGVVVSVSASREREAEGDQCVLLEKSD